MNTFDKFISTYKELEKECRDKGKDIKDYEETFAEEKGAKLRMCRYFRNYIQHYKGYDRFLKITDEMQGFLEGVLKEIKEEDDVIKKHLISIKSIGCDQKEKATEALEKIKKNKRDFVLVFDKDEFLGIAYVYDILSLGKSDKLNKIKKLNKDFLLVEPTDKILEVDRSKILVCKDKNKYLGVVR